MSLYINTNMMAINAARNLGAVYKRLVNSTESLSLGLRIKTAADDPANLAVRELMRTEIASINQGLRNATDAISLIQTADGAMAVINEKLIRMKELAEQAATGTLTTIQREIMDTEYQAMAAEIDRIAMFTDFNGVKLLDGSLSALHQGSGLKVHFGTGNDSDEDYYFIHIGDVRATSQTGLRVGGGRGNNEILTSNGAGVSNPAQPLVTDGSEDGYVGFYYDYDGDGAAAAPSNLAGIYHASSTDRTSLNDLVAQINQGAAARIGLQFGSAAGNGIIADSAAVAQQVTVGNRTINFYNNSAAQAGLGQINIDCSGVANISLATASALNSDANADTFAVMVDDDTLIFFSKAAGDENTAGQRLYADQGGASSNFYFYDVDAGEAATAPDSGSFTLGGEDFITSRVFSQEGGGHELQIMGRDYGEPYDIEWFDMTTLAGSATAWDRRNLAAFDNNFVTTQESSAGPGWIAADITTQSAAQAALDQLSDAMVRKETMRSRLGALQARLENTITSMSIQKESLQGAESKISDLDMAKAMTFYTKDSIITQAAVAMLAQSHTSSQLALSLIL